MISTWRFYLIKYIVQCSIAIQRHVDFKFELCKGQQIHYTPVPYSIFTADYIQYLIFNVY